MVIYLSSLLQIISSLHLRVSLLLILFLYFLNLSDIITSPFSTLSLPLTSFLSLLMEYWMLVPRVFLLRDITSLYFYIFFLLRFLSSKPLSFLSLLYSYATLQINEGQKTNRNSLWLEIGYIHRIDNFAIGIQKS